VARAASGHQGGAAVARQGAEEGGVLAASGLLAFGLAVYLFNWDRRNQSRRGHPLMALLVFVPYVISIFLQ